MKTKKQPRTLTHALLYDSKSSRWSCKCGYQLGIDGHTKLYAICPMSLRDKANRPKPVISKSIELNPLRRRRRAQPKRKELKEGVLEAFDL